MLGSIELCESVESLRLFFARSALTSAMFNGSLLVALVFICGSAFQLLGLFLNIIEKLFFWKFS